jgi:hypothetical protein
MTGKRLITSEGVMARHFRGTILLSSLICISITAFSQIHISGPQSGILTDTTYIVDGDISVEQGDSLVIEAGAIFLFDGAFNFAVSGYLCAIGTELDTIHFRSNVGIQAWLGINVSTDASDSCRLDYCKISGSDHHGLYIVGCNMNISHCMISDNPGGNWGGGIYCVNSSPLISNCIITRNHANMGGGFSCFSSAHPVLSNCIISDNTSSNVGGVHVEVNSTATLYSCIIAGNSAESYDGAVRVMQGSQIDIVSCTIFGNSDNYDRGGINVTSYSSLSMVNTIILGNTGTAVRVDSACQVAVRYCDFYGNTEGNFYGSVSDSLGEIAMTNANGDSCDIFYNIFFDPQFVDTLAGDYHLLAGSPCIDAGDPTSPLDPDSTIADIGAYYYDQSAGINPWTNIETPAAFRLMPNYPNPFNAVTVIPYDLPDAGTVQLSIYNILGQHIATLYAGRLSPGHYTAVWNAGNYPSGLYFARLLAGSNVDIIKMILLK